MHVIVLNRPFYSNELSTVAADWTWGWDWPCFDTNLFPFLVKIRARNTSLNKNNMDKHNKTVGLYQNKVNFCGIRFLPKFMVCILNCSFKFQLQHLNFTTEFNILHSSFRVQIIGKRFYTCLLAFELNFFIWPCSLYIFNSTNKFLYTATFY